MAGEQGPDDERDRHDDRGAEEHDVARSFDVFAVRVVAHVAYGTTRRGLATDGGVVFDDAGSIPIDVQTLTNDVRQASDLAQSAGGPLVCLVMIPSVHITADTDIALAVTAYVSGVVGVPDSGITLTYQNCGDPTTATCANMFQNDLGHMGGRMADTTHAVAQRIEAQAADVGIYILTPVQDGLTLSVIVVLAGVQNGWLVSVATFADRLQCG